MVKRRYGRARGGRSGGRRRRLTVGHALAAGALAAGAANYALGSYAGRKRSFTNFQFPRTLSRTGVGARRRFGPRTRTGLRRRRRMGDGGGGEISFLKKRSGYRRPQTVNKLQMISLAKTIYRYQGVKRMNANSAAVINADGTTGFTCPGFFRLHNTPAVAGDGNRSYFPLHCYDLTTLPQAGTSGRNVAHHMQLYDDGVPYWEPMKGQTAAGFTDENFWRMEDTTLPGTTSAGGNFALSQRFVQQDWIDIRLACYGCRMQPTYWDIMMVTFTRDYLHPCNYEVADNSEDISAYRSLWQGLVKNISYNAILPGAKDAFKGMKVLKRFRFVQNPSDTGEADRNPALKIVKYFHKDYKIRDYNYGPLELVTDAAVNAPNYAVNPEGAGIRDFCRPSQRVYLIIRASNTTPVATGDANADQTPSYDLVIRRQIRHRES